MLRSFKQPRSGGGFVALTGSGYADRFWQVVGVGCSRADRSEASRVPIPAFGDRSCGLALPPICPELPGRRGASVREGHQSVPRIHPHLVHQFQRGVCAQPAPPGPPPGSRWHLDEMYVVVGGVTHWLWRAVDGQRAVLDVLLQRHRDTDAARSFFQRLLGEYDVPEAVCTDKLASYSAAIRKLPMLEQVDHQRVISTARCNNLIEQSHRPTRRQERNQLGFRQVKRTQGFLDLHARITNLHGSARSTTPANDRRFSLRTALRS
ncbi:IS6 family transposase [Deinococcus sp.]|uniref:IS6 family transposase n=1 Tax=Deinococcus sp. TaxID=47478 RepID=UPI003C7D7F4B